MMFTIYSIGDSAFLAQILNAVAMICGTGDFVQLVSIGFLLGVIVICVQSILGGVRELNLQYLVMGWILYGCFFYPTVTVTIEDSYTGQVRVVDNVPLGVGFSGSMISNIGYGVTQLFEQGYQNVASITNEPFAESLRELQAVRRNLDNPKLMQTLNDSLGGATVNIGQSLDNYIRECTMMKLANGVVTLDDLRTTNWSEAIKFESEIFGTRVMVGNGLEDLTCSAAWPRIEAALTQLENGQVIQEINRAISVIDSTGQYPQDLDSVNNALNILGNAATDVQDFIKVSIIEPIYLRAAAGYYTDFHDLAAANMVNQAIAQRNTQWATEQSMFMTTVRPILTFFEGFIYAITPIMGFLFVIGQFGIRLAVRYFQTVIWIQLWMPVMSICNLYIIMAARSEMASLGAGRLDSFYALNRIDDLISTWIATGGMLCTATPIIALFLVTGSTYAFTTLANRLGGGDHVNEKVASPDAVNVGAVHSQESWQSADSMGMMRTGASNMFQTLDLVRMASANVSSARQRLDQAANTLTDAFANNISSGKTFQMNDQFTTDLDNRLDASRSTALSTMRDTMYDFAKKHGATDTQAKEFATTETTRAIAGASGRLGFDTGKGTRQTTFERATKNTNNTIFENIGSSIGSDTTENISAGKGASANLALGINQNYDWMDKDSHQFKEDFAQLQSKISKVGLTDSDVAEFKEAFASTIKDSHSEGFVQDMARSNNESLSEAAQNMLSASASFQQAQTQMDAFSVRGSMKENEFANFLFAEASRNHRIGELENALAHELLLMDKTERDQFNQRYESLMKTNYVANGDMSQTGMKAAALVGTLLRSGETGDYESAGQLIQAATGIQGRTDFDPYGNADIATAHRASGTVNRNVEQMPDKEFNARSGDIRRTAEEGRSVPASKHSESEAEVRGIFGGNLTEKVLQEAVPLYTKWLKETDMSFMDKSVAVHSSEELAAQAQRAGLSEAASNMFQTFGAGYKNTAYAYQIPPIRKEARDALFEENMRLYGNNDSSNTDLIQKLTDAQCHAMQEIANGKMDRMQADLITLKGLSVYVTERDK